MEERGFSFGKHDLYESQPIRYIPKGSELIPPFTSIPGLGIQCAMTITKARENGSFDSVEDFKRRTGLGKKMCEVIRDHGLFDGLSETAQLTLF